MMTDIAERLKEASGATTPSEPHDYGYYWNLCDEAADEIERLTAERDALDAEKDAWQGRYYAAAGERDALKKDAAALWMMLDDIIHMAEQAGIPPAKITSTTPVQYPTSEGLARFARLVAAREREYCWHTCDKLIMYGPVTEAQQRYNQAYGHCKDAIRARGEK